MQEIYLDNAATTAVAPAVRDEMLRVLGEEYGNPSSLHRKGAEAEQLVKEARRRVAAPLRVSEKEIYFTSGGTESNNWALIGAARAKMRRGRHLITTAIEHPSVSAAMDALEKEGFSVTRLPVNKEGLVEADTLKAALRDDTVLVSVMMVNNELGSIEPVWEFGPLIKAFRPDILFHVDAVQAYGKLEILPKRWQIDLLTGSAHKIHGPKGEGFLYIADGVRILPILHGGEQQNGLRSGTENMPGLVGFGKAAQLMEQNREEYVQKVGSLRAYLAKGLTALDGVTVNGASDPAKEAPHILSVTVNGIRSEVLLHALEDKGIYVSAGSACSSHKKTISPTLKAIGLSKEAAESTVRISLDASNTREEAEYVIESFRELLPVLRRFVRR